MVEPPADKSSIRTSDPSTTSVRPMGNRLETGQKLPALPAKDLEGNDADLGAAVADGWGVILLFRGHW